MELVTNEDGITRCSWGSEPEMYRSYHDNEWGHPVIDDHRLFEKICLEGFQAGLSWLTILSKRENFRAGFAQFDPAVVIEFEESDVERLLGDAGIVRHQGKIRSAINNAQCALDLVEECGSLSAYFWSWAGPEEPAPTEILAITATSTAYPRT